MDDLFFSFVWGLILFEIVPLIFGIVWNWLTIPKNSTIKDLMGNFNEWKNDNRLVIPLYMFIIPGINICLVVLMILTFFSNIFDKIIDKTSIKKWSENNKAKIVNIRIK